MLNLEASQKMKNSDVPTCKTCIHNRAGFLERTFNYHPILWECDREIEKGALNPVTGIRRPDRYRTCSDQRIMGCGYEGKYWSPRNTRKFLFTVLKRN